ncbi:MAG: glycine zipper 2TM domain-containing protein [Rhodobacterales bacterium]
MKHTALVIGLSILSVFALSACDAIDNSPHAKTIKGAGVGAATGAVAGAVLGDTKNDIILGTLAGAAIGGVIGNSTE